MEKLKKTLTIVSLATLGIAVAMLIGAVFGLPVFKNHALLKILLTAATISVTSGMAINETAVIKRKRIEEWKINDWTYSWNISFFIFRFCNL